MSDVALFLLGVSLTLVMSLSVVVYLKPHLKTILIDLCGTVERADFWAAFSSATLVLVPLAFALHYWPEAQNHPRVILALSTQLKGSLIGLVVSVAVLGIVISRFIPSGAPTEPPKPNTRAVA